MESPMPFLYEKAFFLLKKRSHKKELSKKDAELIIIKYFRPSRREIRHVFREFEGLGLLKNGRRKIRLF